MKLARQALAEFLGTAGLLTAVIGSGIMAERLAGGNGAVALLANTLATVFALYVLIEVFGSTSGAHFNPLVTLALAWRAPTRDIPRRLLVPAFLAAQAAGAVSGAWVAHLMFDMSVLQAASKVRDGPGLWLGEVVATAGLLVVIFRAPAGRGATLVASYIGAAYWFTSSTSFANPAAVLGRALTDSFAGIAPASAPAFLLAECAGAALGVALAAALSPPAEAPDRTSRP